MPQQHRGVVRRIPQSLARVDGRVPSGAILPEIADVSGMASDLARYRESSNAITRWINGRLSEARSAQEVRMIQAFAARWHAVQQYYQQVAAALEGAYQAQRAYGKLALAELENARDRQLAEMQMQQALAKQYFESFTLQAESFKEQVLEAEERREAIRRRRREEELRLTRLERETGLRLAQIDKEMYRMQVTPWRRRPPRRLDPREATRRILSTIDELDGALRRADQLFSGRDPEMGQEVKQEIREIFRQMWRQQMDGQQPGTEEDDGEGGVGDGAGYADVEPDNWQR